MKRIGFIGTGLMGQPMARRLLEGGYPLTVWNRTTQRAKPLLEAGAVWADSPKTVAQASDVVITMVTDSKASEEVICGENGVLEGAHPGLILIDMGSIAPGSFQIHCHPGEGQRGSHARCPCDGKSESGLRGEVGDYGRRAQGDV